MKKLTVLFALAVAAMIAAPAFGADTITTRYTSSPAASVPLVGASKTDAVGLHVTATPSPSHTITFPRAASLGGVVLTAKRTTAGPGDDEGDGGESPDAGTPPGSGSRRVLRL